MRTTPALCLELQDASDTEAREILLKGSSDQIHSNLHLSRTQPSEVSPGTSSCAQLCVQQETTNGCLCTARYSNAGLNEHSSLLCPSFATSALSPAALYLSGLCKHTSVPLQDIPIKSGTSGYCRKTSSLSGISRTTWVTFVSFQLSNHLSESWEKKHIFLLNKHTSSKS